MDRCLKSLVLVSSLAVAFNSALASEDTGRIQGAVLQEGGGLGGVLVRLQPEAKEQLTDQAGRFAFADVAPGEHRLELELGSLGVEPIPVTVKAGETVQVEHVSDWEFTLIETLTVHAASKRHERLVDAPAAVTAVTAAEIELQGGAAQLPSLLQFRPGIEARQNGLYDYNLNTRGYNGSLTRRIQLLVDGRDPAIPSSYSQEWWTLGLLADDLDSMELVRGPSSALYGPNSVNGVLAMRTKAPRDSLGGQVRLTGGERDTFGGFVRWAGDLGNGFYLKALGGHLEGNSFAQSRDKSVEYAGLPGEVIPLRDGPVSFDAALLRLDKYFAEDRLFTVEVGGADGENETYLADPGRFQELDVERRWARVNFNAPRFNAAIYWDDRHGDQVAMQAGVPLINDGERLRFELQGNWTFADDRIRLVAGGNHADEDIDSADGSGTQTLFQRAVSTASDALFAQADFDVSEKVHLVAAARWDDSDLHDAQVSPKLAMVYTPRPGHSLRFGVNKAFQVGNYTELFLQVPTGPPLDLSGLEASLAPLLGGTPLGFAAVPGFVIGNTELDVEEITSFEVGYRGVLGSSTFLTVDYYFNKMSDFISPFLPGINSNYAPWTAPAGVPGANTAEVEAIVNGAVPGLTNDPMGAALFVVSNANAGKVETQGIELSLGRQFGPRWFMELGYAWSDFNVKDDRPGAPILPNTAEQSASLGVTYRWSDLAISFRHAWSDHFTWASGVFAGEVPSFHVSNLDASWDVNDHWRVGLNVSNLFDERHYEAFGGDILGRRALLHVTGAW